jgi:osomolarity two-component system sensor histidine kinase CHK1
MMGSLSIRTSPTAPRSPKSSNGGISPLLPFTNLGPIEWEFHGLQARVANSPMHGSERYWVTYCPTNGKYIQFRLALTSLDSSKITLLRRAYTILKRIHTDKALPGITLPRHWHDSPSAMLADYNDDHPVVPRSAELIGSVEKFLGFAVELTTRLCELHTEKVRHGALRPESITVTADGKVFLQDFTSASLQFDGEPGNETHAETEYLPYLAPECTGRINRRVDYRSDFYSLGATLFHIITGQPLWGASVTDELDVANKHVTQTPPSTNFHPSIDAVIAKLLAKMPEHRYQTCEGLLSDWKDIQANPDAEFTVGKADQASRFIIPQDLYGRDERKQRLYEKYTHTRNERTSKLVFIKGYSGVGKSALVKEFAGMIQSKHTIFCQGKFDQNKSVPFAAIVQALGDLTRQILTEPASSLDRWRSAIRNALDDEVGVLLPLVPDVTHVLPVDPNFPIPDLEDPIAQEERQKRVLTQFLRVFAERKTLVVFLDDLQWSSKSDLQLLTGLVHDFARTREDTGPSSLNSTLLICAYRDNVVGPSHRVRTQFEDRVNSETLKLNSLSQEDTHHIVCDTLHRPREECRELSQLIFTRTRGNAFFIQRVTSFIPG